MGKYTDPDDISDQEQGNQGDGEVADAIGYEGGPEEHTKDSEDAVDGLVGPLDARGKVQITLDRPLSY